MPDFGCAKTTTRTYVFRRSPNSDKIQVNTIKNVFVQSCSGETSNILGHAALNLHFKEKMTMLYLLYRISQAQKMSIAKLEVEFLLIIWRKGKLHIPQAEIVAFKICQFLKL